MTGFTLSGRLAAQELSCFEAESSLLSLRLTPSPRRASTQGSPPTPPRRLHVEQAIHMTTSFQVVGMARLGLAHRRTRRRHEGPRRYGSLLRAASAHPWSSCCADQRHFVCPSCLFVALRVPMTAFLPHGSHANWSAFVAPYATGRGIAPSSRNIGVGSGRSPSPPLLCPRARKPRRS
jgi:hypothetical protein